MNTLAIEEMDQETADTIDLLMCVASAEQYGYDATMLAYIESRGLLTSTDLVGLEAVDPDNKDKSEVRNAASGRIVAAKAKFDGRMDGAQKNVHDDLEAIKQRLNGMSDKEKKELPWGKIGAVIGVLDGVRKFLKGNAALKALHSGLTEASTQAVTEQVGQLKNQAHEVFKQLEAAKKATPTNAANIANLEAQLAKANSLVSEAKQEGSMIMGLVSKARLGAGSKAALFVLCVAWYTFVWWLTVKVVVGIVRWVKKLVVGSGSSK